MSTQYAGIYFERKIRGTHDYVSNIHLDYVSDILLSAMLDYFFYIDFFRVN